MELWADHAAVWCYRSRNHPWGQDQVVLRARGTVLGVMCGGCGYWSCLHGP